MLKDMCAKFQYHVLNDIAHCNKYSQEVAVHFICIPQTFWRQAELPLRSHLKEVGSVKLEM